jgi:hypothetical protein
LTPQAESAAVVEQVEVDMSSVMNVLMKVPYRLVFDGTIADGDAAHLGVFGSQCSFRLLTVS